MPIRIVIDVRRIRDFGIGTYIRNLVRGLAKVDCEDQFVLVSTQSGMAELEALPSNFEVALYSGTDYGISSHVAFPFYLRRFSADLFHLPLNNVPIAMPKPYVVTIHDMSSLLFEETAGWRNSLRVFTFRRGLLRADRVIAVSAATRRDVEDLMKIPSERIRQIYNAPDPKFLERSPGTMEQREAERLNILERYQICRPFLLYTGNIRQQKNIPRLVEAFAVVRGDLETHPLYKDLRLIIIGDEISRYPSVRRAVIQTRMEHCVRFLGFVPIETLRVFYESASAFVFPSLYEGFGLPPLEAMASGTPVVTSSVSSLPEVVGNAAVMVNPENVFDIARGMREVLLDEDLRESLIRRGYEQLQRFSWQRTAQQVLDTYREVAGAS